MAVAVVSWNTRDLLGAALDSLRADADPDAGLAEVWVVDNASTDGSAAFVRDAYPWVHLIAADANLGYGPAVNLVGRRTAAPWIAAANADIAFTPGSLAALVDAGARAPAAGALAPRLLAPDGSTQHSVHAFPTPLVTLVFNLGVWRALPGAGERLCLHGQWDSSRPREVDWAHGALLLLRRAAWEEIGGFDDDQWLYAEDLDICWRLARAGWTTRYEPGATVHHAISAATRTASWGNDREVRAQASAYAWMERQFGRTRARACATINLSGALVRWAPAAVAARLDPAGHADARDRRREYVRMHATGFARRS